MRRARWVHLCLGAGSLRYPFARDASQDVALPPALGQRAGRDRRRRSRVPARPAAGPWILLAVGFALYVVGDLVYTAYELTRRRRRSRTVGDIAYLLFYPLVFTALGGFLRAAGDRDRAAWLDASIWTVGAVLLAWEPLIEPFVIDSAAAAARRRPSALAYPLIDIGLLLMRAADDRRTRRPDARVLAADGRAVVADRGRRRLRPPGVQADELGRQCCSTSDGCSRTSRSARRRCTRR